MVAAPRTGQVSPAPPAPPIAAPRSGDGQHLMSGLDRGVDPLVGFQTRVRGPAVHHDLVPRGALAGGLERARLIGGRLQHEGRRESAARIPRSARREVGEPTSSSPVTSTHTPSGDGSDASAWNICTSPAFMSRTPGHGRLPSTTDQGWVSSEPTRPHRVVMPHEQHAWRAEGPPQMGHAVDDDRLRRRPQQPRAEGTDHPALRATASWSAEKDSQSTSSSRSASMAGRAITFPPRTTDPRTAN